MSGSGSGSAPPTPISPFLAPSAGVRYPLYAAVQGSPLLYSPAIFGQTMFPWRPSGATQLTAGTVSTSSSSSASSPTSSASSSSQAATLQKISPIPSLVYPMQAINLPMLPSSGHSTIVEGGKRKSEGGGGEGERKRLRLSESTPHSPSLHSTPSLSPKLTPTLHASQRSPVIKFIPYNPGQAVVLQPNVSMTTTSVMPPSSQPPSLPHTPPHAHTFPPSQRHASTPPHPTPVSEATQSPHLPPSLLHPPLLPDDLPAVLLKCFGPITDSVVTQSRLHVSTALQDLYRPSYFTTSSVCDPPLSPESCALLTICYLSALKSGEVISAENLRTMMQYARHGEGEWLHYYRKHKKMSESTFVQSQLMHLARLTVYPALGKVRVMIAKSLGEGVAMALHGVAQLGGTSSTRGAFPDYVVVLAIRPSSSVDFCVLVLEPLQVRLLHCTSGFGEGGRKEREGEGRRLAENYDGSPAGVQLVMNSDLLAAVRSFQRRLEGLVFAPFHNLPPTISANSTQCSRGATIGGASTSLLPPGEAEILVPSAPHVVEHKPQGPFQDQYNVAMFMLQRLMGSWENRTKIEEFEGVDFRVLCPPEETFVQQTITEALSSRLLDYLKPHLQSKSSTARNTVEKKVIRCGHGQDREKFTTFLREAESRPKTLYIVVSECAHLTGSVAKRHTDQSGSSRDGVLSDNDHLLASLPNCVLVSVSSHPYALQTSRSLFLHTNEIHWPRPQAKGAESGEVRFCSAVDYQAYSSPWKLGVTFREDKNFEEAFQNLSTKLRFPTDLAIVRAQYLLNDYTAALLTTTHHPSPLTPSPETQEIANKLVQAPLSSPRAYGGMVLIRSHDTALGREFYRKLRAVRDALGLNYRFAVILDDGRRRLGVSEHFLRRVARRNRRRHGNVSSEPVSLDSYCELENLSCVVVLCGSMRAGLSFPSSLSCVDLRLCHSALVSRAVYEYDISLLNGYRQCRTQSFASSFHLHGNQSRDNSQMECEVDSGTDEGLEVFENASDQPDRSQERRGVAHSSGSISSSTSSKKSSADEDQLDSSPSSCSSHTKSGVVEWRPAQTHRHRTARRETKHSPSGDLETKTTDDVKIDCDTITSDSCNGDIGDDIHGCKTVTVTIDPPNDQLEHVVPLPAHSRDGASGSHDSSLSFQSDDAVDLFADLESESEEEEDVVHAPSSCVCLLSRPYYHIWSSRNPYQHFLLPPAPGVDWHGGHKRPPLFDPDPQNQSTYYRKWSKPGDRAVKLALDTVMKEISRGLKRRFLLTGPPQVGKTGAWLLFIRLLQDHIRSSRGVMVINEPLPSSLFVSNGTIASRANFVDGDASPINARPTPSPQSSRAGGLARHSRIISTAMLQELSRAMDGHDNSAPPEWKPNVTTAMLENATPGQSMESFDDARHTVYMPLSTRAAHDCSHSCTACSKYLGGGPGSRSEIFTSVLPTGNGPVTIQWSVPASQLRHCVVSPDRTTLERIKLSTFKPKSDKLSSHPLTPIFTVTTGRDATGLLNLFHAGFEYVHVVVTTSSQLEAYSKVWPNQLIMALPDRSSLGLGHTYHTLKSFVMYNYQLNEAAVQYDHPGREVWPMVVVKSDSCVMWRRIGRDGDTNGDVSLSAFLSSLESSPTTLENAAIGLPQWSSRLDREDAATAIDSLSDYDLSHDFLLLNLPKLTDVQYSCNNYNSCFVDFNLQLKACGLKATLRRDIVFVRKLVKTGGNPYPLRPKLNGLSTDVDKLVLSLHHDSSSLLPHPGPYLMEHYLLRKSPSLFPYALNSETPVLMVDKYVNLGPSMHVTFVKSEALQRGEFADSGALAHTWFSGLVLYLCRGKVSAEQLEKINFIPGACLCLVTRDCKSLVREVARLDLEERWKFRLRDEYQTACPDNLRPLFFLVGRFEH